MNVDSISTPPLHQTAEVSSLHKTHHVKRRHKIKNDISQSGSGHDKARAAVPKNSTRGTVVNQWA